LASYEPEYGAYNADGLLVNEGDEVYTESSWNEYVQALAEAVELAIKGRADANDADAVVSKVYSAKTALQIAENNLEVVTPDSEGITISGTVMIAKDATGTKYETFAPGIDILVNGEVVATSADDGTFTAVVPVGTTDLVFTGGTTIDRTVTLSGTTDVTDVVVPVIVCDYNNDGKINSTDTSAFLSYKGGDYYVYADFNGDGKVNSTDTSIYCRFVRVTIEYPTTLL
jgi:hypothetical protein